MKKTLPIFFTLLFCWGLLSAQEASQEAILVDWKTQIKGDLVDTKKVAQQEAMLEALLIAAKRLSKSDLYQNNQAVIEQILKENVMSYINDYQFLGQRTQGSDYLLKLRIIPKWYFLKNKLNDWGLLGFGSVPLIKIGSVQISPEVTQITQSQDYWIQALTKQLRNQGMNVQNDPSMTSQALVIDAKIDRVLQGQIHIVFSIWDQKNQTRYERKYQKTLHTDESMVVGFMGLYLVENLMPIWFETQGNQRVFDITIQNMSHMHLLQELVRVLENQKGVIQNVRDKSYTKGAATLQINVLADQLDMARYLSGLEIENRTIKVISQSNQKITIEIHSLARVEPNSNIEIN